MNKTRKEWIENGWTKLEYINKRFAEDYPEAIAHFFLGCTCYEITPKEEIYKFFWDKYKKSKVFRDDVRIVFEENCDSKFVVGNNEIADFIIKHIDLLDFEGVINKNDAKRLLDYLYFQNDNKQSLAELFEKYGDGNMFTVKALYTEEELSENEFAEEEYIMLACFLRIDFDFEDEKNAQPKEEEKEIKPNILDKIKNLLKKIKN